MGGVRRPLISPRKRATPTACVLCSRRAVTRIRHCRMVRRPRTWPRMRVTPTACVFCSRRAVTRTRHARMVRRPLSSPCRMATPTAYVFWRRLAARMARFLVEVRAIGKPVACFDLLMLSKQLPYVFCRALSQEARAFKGKKKRKKKRNQLMPRSHEARALGSTQLEDRDALRD